MKPRTYLVFSIIFLLLGLAMQFGPDFFGGPIAAVIVEESASGVRPSIGQVAAMNSPEAAKYMADHAYPFLARIDPDLAARTDPPTPEWVKRAIGYCEGVELPALVILSKDNLRLVHVRHVSGESDVLPVLKRYGG